MENKKIQDNARSLSISETCKPLLKKSKILFLKKDENENYRDIKSLSKLNKNNNAFMCCFLKGYLKGLCTKDININKVTEHDI